MLFSRRIPKKADIFIQSKYIKKETSSYKPRNRLKISGIIITSAAVLFSTAVFFAPQPHQTDKLTAATMPNGYVSPCSKKNCQVRGNNNFHYNYHPNIHNNVIQPIVQPNYASPATYYPYSDSNSNCYSSGYTCNSYPNYSTYTDYNTTYPSIAPINTTIPSNTTVNQPNGGNISSLSQQLVTIQQQIGSQMQACVDNANKAAQQIVGLMNKQKQLQAQIDALNNQANNIDTSTPAGQNQQNALNQRIQQLQQVSDNLGNAISNAQDNMNNANSQCQDNVSNLEQNRGTLESNLDDAFSNAMNIQLPSD